jgi:hypothetical protein
MRTALARAERADPTPAVRTGHVLAQQPLPHERISLGEYATDHCASTPATEGAPPHEAATRTIVRVQPIAATTHAGSNAATTSGPVPD